MQLAWGLLLSSRTVSAERDQRCKTDTINFAGAVLATQSLNGEPMRPPDRLSFFGTLVVVRSANMPKVEALV